jgi:hypothetical protein
MIDQLKKFGKVEICKKSTRTFHIKITDGFKGDFSTGLKVIKIINNHLTGNYTRIMKCIAKENDFEYIVKK